MALSLGFRRMVLWALPLIPMVLETTLVMSSPPWFTTIVSSPFVVNVDYEGYRATFELPAKGSVFFPVVIPKEAFTPVGGSS